MSALHQPPPGIPRYLPGRVSSSYEQDTSMKENNGIFAVMTYIQLPALALDSSAPNAPD